MKYSPIHTQLRKLSARAGLPSFRAVGVSKRRTQAATLVLRLMGRPATSSAVSCAGLKRPCTGPYLEGRAKKDIPMLGSLGSVTNSHRASANGQERHIFKELKCYVLPNILTRHVRDTLNSRKKHKVFTNTFPRIREYHAMRLCYGARDDPPIPMNPIGKSRALVEENGMSPCPLLFDLTSEMLVKAKEHKPKSKGRRPV